MSKNEVRLIDANALLDHVKDLPTCWADGGGVYPGEPMKYPDGMFEPEDVISSIENAPTIEAYTEEDVRNAYTDGFSTGMEQGMQKPGRPKGRWVEVQGKLYCYVCGNRMPDRAGEENLLSVGDNRFCRYCGAKMEV